MTTVTDSQDRAATRSRVIDAIEATLGRRPANIDTATLDDMGIDSLDLVEVAMAIEDDLRVDLGDDLAVTDTVDSITARIHRGTRHAGH